MSRVQNGFLTITRAPAREPRRITFGAEVRVEHLNPSVKEVEKPLITDEMPEAIEEVQAVLTGTSVADEVAAAPKRPRGRPRKQGGNDGDSKGNQEHGRETDT